jgi:hypothetical protein
MYYSSMKELSQFLQVGATPTYLRPCALFPTRWVRAKVVDSHWKHAGQQYDTPAGGEYDLYLSIVLYGLVEELNILGDPKIDKTVYVLVVVHMCKRIEWNNCKLI